MRASLPAPVLVIALFGALTCITFVGLGAPFGSGDEIIYAQNAREMAADGDLGVLPWQGQPSFQRPPTPFWLSVASAKIFGSELLSGEAALRLPMALCSLAILALVYAMVVRTWKRVDAAIVAAVLCASAPGFHLFSRALLSDPPFTCALVAAFAGTLWCTRDPRGYVLVGAGMGVAIAMKSLAAGPMGLLLLPWVAMAFYRQRAWNQHTRYVAAAVLAFVATALPYFVYSYVRFGSEFLEGHFGANLGRRLAGGYNDTVGMSGGSVAYLRHIVFVDGWLAALWILGAPVASLVLWRRGDRDLGIAACTSLGLLLLFSLAEVKLPHYILAVYPIAAVATGGLLAALSSRFPVASTTKARALAAAVLLSVFLVGLTRPIPDSYLLPAPFEHRVGKELAKLEAPETLYTLDWYAPALAYYAERPWKALFRNAELVAKLREIRFFEAADAIRHAPPWPQTPFLLIAPIESLLASGFDVSTPMWNLDNEVALIRVETLPAPTR